MPGKDNLLQDIADLMRDYDKLADRMYAAANQNTITRSEKNQIADEMLALNYQQRKLRNDIAGSGLADDNDIMNAEDSLSDALADVNIQSERLMAVEVVGGRRKTRARKTRRRKTRRRAQ